MVIHSYSGRATKRFVKGDRRRLPAALHTKVDDVLGFLEEPSCFEQLRISGYRVHALTGDRKGFNAVEISGAWRVVFR